MTRPATHGDVALAEDVVRLRNLAADNLDAAKQALITAQNDLAAWELECWKRLPLGHGVETNGRHWRLVKLERP